MKVINIINNFKMHNNNPTETFFRNLQLELDRNPELNLELQAENHDDDY
jgi:hypothetical protein